MNEQQTTNEAACGGSALTAVLGHGTTGKRIESLDPKVYRLAKRNGEMVLQGAYYWSDMQDGMPCGGFEWRDIPTVELSA